MTVSVFLALDPAPPASDTPVLPRNVSEEVGVNWPWRPPASRTEFKSTVPGSFSFGGKNILRGRYSVILRGIVGDLDFSRELSSGRRGTGGVRRR